MKQFNRRSIRLKKYNYAQEGLYFVTICTQNRECIFGKIIDGAMVLNEVGKMACDEWMKLPFRYPHISLNVFQIMPNHIHGIIIVGATLAVAHADNRATATDDDRATATDDNRATARVAPTLGNIIGAYKSLVTNGCLKIYKSKNELMGKL
ncbi:MAG: hypothetical protein LBN93_05265, partial [Candidatus Symbiothrix sp.]|nr:hypothetical protein [Candidatus Symbiothrix sp.]